MALRISSSSDGSVTTVRVEGRLEVAGVQELRGVCRGAADRLRLDLSGLQGADPLGIETLRQLLSEGAESHGASAYIRQLMGQDAS